MNSQRKNHQAFLQKGCARWKWMAGATAATAAGVTASQAGLVTINLTGNYISSTGGNHLNADLTGDGHPDLTITNAFNYVNYVTTNGHPLPYYGRYNARANLNGILASAFRINSANPNAGYEQLGPQRTFYRHSGSSLSGTYQLTGSIPIFFKDLHINGGAPTGGLLEVTVSTGFFELAAKVQLDSLTYTSNTPGGNISSAVPEQGSSLALLAMGAGGILALRGWRAAQSSNRQLPAQTS